MLEILGLIYFIKQIGPIADRKGVNAGGWKVMAALAWIITEITVVVLLTLNGVEQMAMILFGPLSGILGYFIVRQILSSKPDKDDELLAEFGKDVQP